MRGTARGGEISGKVQGSDSVRVEWKGSIETLNKCCEFLLVLYKSEKYKERFEFIDHLRPLPSSNSLVEVLERKLRDLLAERDKDRLSIAHPDVPSFDIETFKIWCGRVNKEVNELDLDTIFSFLEEYERRKGEAPDILKTWIIELDGEGQPRSRKTPLHRYLVAHVELNNHVYVLSLGRWFRTDRNYLDELRKKARSIDDVTEKLKLPHWPRGLREEYYNKRLEDKRGWLRLDRKMFTFRDPRRKIECADFLTPEQDFIHVKSMESSATLSHLFAQGSVSAQLFRVSSQYRDQVSKLFQGKYGRCIDGTRGRVVYAIGIENDEPVAESLFFFSLVNLVQHKDRLEAMSWPVAICKITRTGKR